MERAETGATKGRERGIPDGESQESGIPNGESQESGIPNGESQDLKQHTRRRKPSSGLMRTKSCSLSNWLRIRLRLIFLAYRQSYFAYLDFLLSPSTKCSGNTRFTTKFSVSLQTIFSVSLQTMGAILSKLFGKNFFII